MGMRKLGHYSIRTKDLERSLRFYVDILGLRTGYRPPFDFPGAWLYLPDDDSDFGVVHIIGIDPDDPSGLLEYMGDKPDLAFGSASIDHLAFLATGLEEMQARAQAAGVPYRERTVPSLHLHQLFLEDPSGVVIELNYPASEAAALASKSGKAMEGA